VRKRKILVRPVSGQLDRHPSAAFTKHRIGVEPALKCGEIFAKLPAIWLNELSHVQ
jgi:hypothetical protein